MQTFELQTSQRNQCVDITTKIADLVDESGIKEGLCHVFCPHTSAGIMINENADPDVKTDFIAKLEKEFPKEDEYIHDEGNSDSHMKMALVGESRTVIIHKGQLVLGTWQGIFFAEFDGPRNRGVCVKIMGEK